MENIAPPVWSLNEDNVQHVLLRAHQNRHPLRDLEISDVEKIITEYPRFNNRDEWGQAWLSLARSYVREGQFCLSQQQVSKAVKAFQLALRYFYVARWPIPNSAIKKQAYDELIETFILLGQLNPQQFQVLSIPYRGKVIKAYLHHPGKDEPVPVVIHWGGIDTWKEDLTYIANAYVSQGWASVTVDMPGTGECPELASPQGESVFLSILDHLQSSVLIDKNKIALQGSSWGGYWATKLAFIAQDRIKGAINWGGPIHYFFEPDWQSKALASKEYLFDARESVMALYGTHQFKDYLALNHQMSLKTQDLLSLTNAKMLYINGAKDTLVPIAELDLISKIKHVDSWVNTQGIHMGISQEINHYDIMKNIILPWLNQLFKE